MSETTVCVKTLEDNGDGGEGTGKGSCALRIVLPANLVSSLEKVIENYILKSLLNIMEKQVLYSNQVHVYVDMNDVHVWIETYIIT